MTTSNTRSEQRAGESGSDGEVAAQIRGSGLLLAGRVLSLAINLLTQVLAVRHLSVSGYGAFAYGITAASFCQSLVAPHPDVFARFFAVDDDARDRAGMAGTLLFGLLTSLGLGTLVFGGAWLFRDALASSLSDRGAVDVVIVLVLLAPVQAADGVFQSLCAVLGRTRAIFVRKYVFAPLARLVAVGLLITTDGGPLFLAIGYVAAAAFGLAVYGAVVTGLLREREVVRHLRPGRANLRVRAIVAFSLPFLAANLVYDAMTFFTVAVLGHSHGTEEVAAVQAVLPAARLNELAMWTFGMLYVALAARLTERRAFRELRDAYWHTATWVAVLTFPVFALTVPFADSTTTLLFGARYEGSALYLAVLAAATFTDTVLGLNEATLQVLGRIRLLLGINAAVGALSVAATLVVVPAIGAAGAVLVFAVTRVGVNVACQIFLARQMQMPVLDRQHLRALAVLAALALALAVIHQTIEAIWAPPALVSLAEAAVLTAVASAIALAVTRRHLRLTETFPELHRLPVLGRVL